MDLEGKVVWALEDQVGGEGAVFSKRDGSGGDKGKSVT